MWSCAGRDALLAFALAACGADPTARFEVTRALPQKVSVALCDGAECNAPADLFTEGEPTTRTKTLDVFLDDATPMLAVRFQHVSPAFCNALLVTFDNQIEARVELPADTATPATVSNCESCSFEDCDGEAAE